MTAAPLVDEDEILGPSPHDHDEEAFERASVPCHASYCDYCDEWLTEPHVEPFTMGPTWQRDALGRFVLPKEYREVDDPPDTIYTIGHIAVRWIEKWLQLGGEPIRLTAEQIRFIMWWYAIDLNGRWYYRDGTLQRLKGWGKDPLAAMLCLFELCGPARFERWIDRDGLMLPKAREVVDAWVSISGTSKEQPLALDTLVPTPDGPRKMADLHVGDRVFGSDGRPVVVARETEVMYDLDCYRVTFDDGTTVVASASHGWTVDYLASGHGRKTLTMSTAELADRYLGKGGTRRARIPLVGRLTPDVDLPIEPYTLGLWLGDGASANPTIAASIEDAGEIEQILRAAGQRVKRYPDLENDRGHRWARIYVGGTVHTALKALGIRGNKSVPEIYLNAGTEQRRALLQGLLDSDGCITAAGRIMFTNTNRSLIDATVELARSLGYKPTVRGHSTAGWTVSWLPIGDAPLFRLRRKEGQRQRFTSHRGGRHRTVVDVERVPSVPVKCIGIDTEDHLFQVESGVLTHNTKNTMAMIPQLVTPKLKAKYALEVNKQITYAYGGVRRLEVTSTSPATAEGNRPTFQIGGEPHHWTAATDGIDMQKVMTRNAAKRPAGESRILWVTNAFDPAVESVGRATREAAEVALASGNEARILYDTLEAPANARLIRREIPVVLEAVRGDAVWLDIPNLTSTILDTRSAPSESRRFYFNQIVADEEAYFPGTAIEATVHETVKAWRRDPDIEFESISKIGWGLVGPDEDVVMFFDGGKSGDSTAVSARRLSDGYTFTIGHWAKPPRLEDPKHEWVAPVAVVEERIHEAFRRFKIVAFYGDPSHAFDDEGDTPYWVPMLDRLHRAYKGQLRNWPVKTGNRQHSILFDMSNQLNLSKFVPAAMAFREEIREGVITHDGHPMAMNNMRNARQVSTKFGVTIGKRNRQSPQKVDQAVTHAGCKMLADIVLNAEEQSSDVPEVGELWV